MFFGDFASFFELGRPDYIVKSTTFKSWKFENWTFHCTLHFALLALQKKDDTVCGAGTCAGVGKVAEELSRAIFALTSADSGVLWRIWDRTHDIEFVSDFFVLCLFVQPGKHNVLEDYLNTEVVKDIIFLHFMWSQMMFLGCWQPFGLRNPHMGRIHNWMSQIGSVDKFQNTWGTPRHRLPDSPWLWPLSNKEPLASDLRPEP